MKSYFLPVLACVAIMFFSSCGRRFVGAGVTNTPANNFETLWHDFNEHYGAFVPKHIDWKAQYLKYRGSLSENMSEKDLFDTLSHMLDVLNDGHVYLRPTSDTKLPWYAGGMLGRTIVDDYRRTVTELYLLQKTTWNHALEYGVLAGNIGYINIKSFAENINTYPRAMDTILKRLENTKGIIIELRENGGGEDRVSQYIANRFASDRHFSFSSSIRNGPGDQDFSEPIPFYTRPEGKYQYTKPVILLTNLNTFSSGETFVLAMLQNKNVKIVGGTTGGALSDAMKRELPNGWLYRLPFADVRDANGKNLEGIGIEPHVKIKNTRAELDAGIDRALETAMELLSK